MWACGCRADPAGGDALWRPHASRGCQVQLPHGQHVAIVVADIQHVAVQLAQRDQYGVTVDDCVHVGDAVGQWHGLAQSVGVSDAVCHRHGVAQPVSQCHAVRQRHCVDQRHAVCEVRGVFWSSSI